MGQGATPSTVKSALIVSHSKALVNGNRSTPMPIRVFFAVSRNGLVAQSIHFFVLHDFIVIAAGWSNPLQTAIQTYYDPTKYGFLENWKFTDKDPRWTSNRYTTSGLVSSAH